LLLINFMHLLKKPPIPTSPPEEMLLMSTQMDEAFDQADDVMNSSTSISESIPETKEYNVETGAELGDTPPDKIENTIKKEGFEWVEWPAGSGQNFYRSEKSGGEWLKWPVE